MNREANSTNTKSVSPCDKETLEQMFYELARDMKMYDKYEYPAEWKEAADKWNDLLMNSQEHEMAGRILLEYGLR